MTNKLPDNWELKMLSEVGDIIGGGTPDTTKKEYWNGNISWVIPSEVTSLPSKYLYATERKITELGLKNSSAKIIKPNSLIICTRATIGNCCINKNEVATNQGFKSIIPNENYDVIFLYYLISNNKQKLISKASGTTFLEISKSNLKNLSFYFPPLEEQKRIASALSKIEAYLENTIKLIEEKERFKKGMAKKLLTCKEGENVPEMRFKEFNDKWETKTLMSVADIKKGEQRNKLDLIPNGKYPVLNGGMNFSGYYNSYNREANTITISEGGNAGYVNFIKEKFWSSGHCYTLHDLKIDKNFLYQCLKNSEKRLMKLRHGTALKNIKISEIIEFTLDMPKSIEEQKIIGEYLSLLDAEIDNLKEQKEEIKKMKSGIIKKLMSGEVRL